MPKIKIRISLNKGRKGIPLDKLGNISNETLKYLKLFCRDMGIPANKSKWVASNFKNGSVDYDVSLVGYQGQRQVKRFTEGILSLASLDEGGALPQGWISNEAILQYAQIAKHIDPDEQILFGIYSNGDKRPKEWKSLTKDKASEIVKMIKTTVEYYGAVTGTIHSLFKGAQPPHFMLRDSLTGDLLKCTYQNQLYKDVVISLERNDAIVNVFGLIVANAITKKIEGVEASKIKAAPIMTENDYNEFFGCAPDITCDHLYEE